MHKIKSIHIKQIINTLSNVALWISFLLLVSSCQQGEEITSINNHEPYYFDGTTIIETIDTGESVLFSQASNIAQMDNSLWDFDNYLKVINTFADKVLGIDLENYNLTLISLAIDCRDIDTQFNRAMFRFSRMIEEPERMREVYYFSVSVNNSRIFVSHEFRSPVTQIWEPVNETELAPDEFRHVIAVADENGGSEVRGGIAEGCYSISLAMRGYEGERFWEIDYNDGSGKVLPLRIVVFPGTDEIIIQD